MNFARIAPLFSRNRRRYVCADNGLAVQTCGRTLIPMIDLGAFGSREPRAALLAGLAFELPLMLAVAAAQEQPIRFAQNGNAEKLDALKQNDEKLKSARDEQRKAAETEAVLQRQNEQIRGEPRHTNN